MNSNNTPSQGKIILYETADGEVKLDVTLGQETVWLSLDQIAYLFGRDKSVISRHLRNVFASGELKREAVVAKNATTASDGKTYQVDYFSLDAILSVGYRVNTLRGTQFRIWATRLLREHLITGYTLNERRLRERGIHEIEQTLALLTRTLTQNALVSDEGQAVLEVIQRYSRSWQLLLAYDENQLAETPAHPQPPSVTLSLDAARLIIQKLRITLAERNEATSLFGQERGDLLAAILGNIEQTFDGEALYPTAQERAAHLLYFLIKDHPFSDGNKRIGVLLFLEYLHLNRLLVRPDGQLHFADNALVALALLIAASDPAQKRILTRLILNLLDSVP